MNRFFHIVVVLAGRAFLFFEKKGTKKNTAKINLYIQIFYNYLIINNIWHKKIWLSFKQYFGNMDFISVYF